MVAEYATDIGMKNKPDTPLYRYRQRAEKTLEALASQARVDKSTWLRWEEGKAPVNRLADIESITGIPRYELRPDIFVAARTGTGG